MNNPASVVDIIVPVFKGYRETRDCVGSLLRSHPRQPFNIIIIDDQSPDARISQYLRQADSSSSRITLVYNSSNLGYAASVNRGIELHPDRDVLLLNSDAVVANDWLDRIVACACQDRRIATVTPFSNNATICGFPVFCRNNLLPVGCSTAFLDRVFTSANAGAWVEIPTAVGFCMFIKRQCLDQVGLFDTINFDCGYGEENDFCMRSRRSGWKHALAADTFVYHAGAISFGSEKEALSSVALSKLQSLYPAYIGLIQQHVDDDPARPFRALANIELVRQKKLPVILFISHGCGGGTDRHIKDMMHYLKGCCEILLIKPSGTDGFCLYPGPEADADGLGFRLPEDYDYIKSLCRSIKVRRVHVHHIMGVHSNLLQLAGDLSIPLDITLHDYYLINANPTLTDQHGRFCAVPESRDELCAMAHPIPGKLSAGQWREKYKELLYSADRVIAPCYFVADLYRTYFPKLRPIVALHPESSVSIPAAEATVRRSGNFQPMRILVMGVLAREKGADILEETARVVKAQQLPLEFHLLGYAYRILHRSVTTHGAYRDECAAALILKINPDVIWFPSQCPETYNYTLSHAMRSGLPIVAPELGAYPERLAKYSGAWLEKWDRTAAEWSVIFTGLREQFIRQELPPVSVEPPIPNRNFYRTDYLAMPQDLLPSLGSSSIDRCWIEKAVYADWLTDRNCLNNREKLLVFLLRLRRFQLVNLILKWVPLQLQRKAKRMLSFRPIHEINHARETTVSGRLITACRTHRPAVE